MQTGVVIVASVETVRGPVDVDDLGTVLMHEHVFVLSEEIRENYPDYWDEDTRVADAVTKLTALKKRGVDTIVDPTVVGLGRYIPRIQKVNEQVDINIVPATGLYTYDSTPFFLHYVGPDTLFGGDDPMIAMFVYDLTEGIAGTSVKAGFLKCAIESKALHLESSGYCARWPQRIRRPARRSPSTPTRITSRV